ncbi:MAG: hypothetical protein L0I79_04435 [Atopostipes sp.]|nr:hypothetical protein [Atopostipes sp.]
MVRLIKSLDMLAGSEFRRQSISNYQMIERALNDYYKKMDKHQSEDEVAHSTEQIKEGPRSQADINKDLQSQIGRLVIAPRNNSANEIVQARVNMFGYEFETLKENINDWQQKTHIDKEETVNELEKSKKEVLDVEFRFEPKKEDFKFVTNLSPLEMQVMQYFHIDDETGIIYMTQVAPDGDGYTLTRTGPNGKYLDQMTCKGAGHGTHVGVRREEDGLWFYSPQQDRNGIWKLVKFPYTAGVVQTYGLNDMQDVFMGDRYNVHISTVINERENLIMYRVNGLCEIRSLTDIDNHIDKVLYKITIPDNLIVGTNIFQGVTFDDGILYWWSGSSKVEELNLLTAFDLKTGKQLYQRAIDIGGLDKKYAGNFAEPEGMQIYYDKESGKKGLLLGIVTGGLGNRTHQIFAIGQRGVFEKLKAKAHPVMMTDTGGRVKPLPVELKNDLSQIREPGNYYLTVSTVKAIDDFPLPSQWRDASWFLIVDPPNASGDIRQTIYRNSYVRSIMTFERLISDESYGGVGYWNYVLKQSSTAERVPTFINKMEDINIVGLTMFVYPEDTKRLIDFPKKYTNVASWMIHVEQQETGGFTQRVVSFSRTGNTVVLMKHYHANGNHSRWQEFIANEVD